MYRLLTRAISHNALGINLTKASLNLRTVNSIRCLSKGVSYSSSVAQPRLDHRTPLTLDMEFSNLDEQIKRRGRIMRKDIDKIYSEIKRIGSSPHSIHSLLLIRCCGSLLPTEKPEARTELVQNIWRTLQKSGDDLDISHYNALLSIYLQNNHKFCPTEFLQEMLQKGIEPNRVTYQHMISQYCQEGDMVNAGKILEHMKEKKMAITEPILNSLITGHSRARDLDSARGVFEVMRQANMEPTGASYTALLCGLAEKGDMEGVRQVLKEAAEKEVYLSGQNLLEVVLTLARAGHSQYVEEILSMVQSYPGLIQHATNVALELASMGQTKLAVMVYLHLQKSYSRLGGVARMLISELTAANVGMEELLEVCQSLVVEPSPLHHLVESLYLAQRYQDVPAILETLHQNGHQLRSHYFWPLLVHHSKDTKAMLRVLELMVQLQCKPTMETWINYVGPCSLEQLNEVGLMSNTAYSGLVQQAIRNKELARARELLAHDLRPSILTGEQQVSVSISQALKWGANPKEVVELVGELLPMASQQWPSSLLKRLADDGHREVLDAHLLPYLEAKNIKLQPIIKDQLKNLLSHSNSKAIKLIEKMNEIDQEGDIEIRPRKKMDLSNKTEEELEEQLAFQKMKGYSTRNVTINLFQACARNKNLERMEELLTELPNPPNYILGAKMDAYMAENMLEEALKTMNEMEKDVIHSHRILRLSSHMIKQDKVEEAMQMLKEHQSWDSQDNRAEENVCNVLRAAASMGLVQEIQDLFNLLVKEKKLCKVTGKVLAPLVKVHVVRNDLDKALETFLECANQYRLTPMSAQLFRKMIEMEDTERLQKVMEACSRNHGEKDALQTLALAFLECGQPNKASRILETSGLRANNALLRRSYEHYLQSDQLDVLEKLAEVAENLFDLDKQLLYHMIMKGCVARKDHERALNTWTTMQEKQILPLPETMCNLADLLESCGQPIPFKRPEVLIKSPEVDTKAPQARDDTVKQTVADSSSSLLEETVNQNSLQDLIKEDKHHTLVKELVEMKTAPRRVVRYFLKSLAEAGKLAEVKELSQVYTGKDYRAYTYLGQTYVNLGQQLEYLELIEQGQVAPAISVLERMLDNHPDLEPRILELAAANPYIYNAVVISRALHSRYEEAKELVKKCDNIMLRRLLREAVSSENLELIREMASWPEVSPMSDWKKIDINNVYIKILVAKGELHEALQVYDRDQSLPIHSQILASLQAKLEEAGLPIPDSLRAKAANESQPERN